MLKIKSVDMLNGNLFKAICIYGIPVILIGLIQQLFNAVDIMVLGFVASDNAIASVGATSTIISLLITAFYGISSGVKIVLSRFLGAGDDEKIKKTVSTAILSSLLFGALVMIVGILIAPWFLTVTKCPAECYDGALLYMRIYVAAAPAILLYNFGSAVISTTGDSQRPLYYMIISGGLNVVLNLVLCLLMKEKVAAVAIATAVSQAVGAFLVVYRICRMDGVCRLDLKKLSWSGSAFFRIFANGAPIGLANTLYPLANLQIQTQINSFGAAAIAGNSAMVSIEGIVSSITSAPWASTVSVFAGQNIGARKYDRVKKVILYNFIIAVTLSIVLDSLATLFSRHLLLLYVSDEMAIHYAQIRMMYTLLPAFISAINTVLSHTIQSFGYSAFCSINSIISVFGFRIVWMQFVYPLFNTFGILMQCFLVSWLLVITVNTIFFFYLYYGKFKTGKLKKMT